MIGAYVENINQLSSIKKDFFQKYEKYITSYDVVFLVEGYTSQRTYLLTKMRTKRLTKNVVDTMWKGMELLQDTCSKGYL